MKIWRKFIRWIAKDQIDLSWSQGRANAYSGLLLTTDYTCPSIIGYFEGKTGLRALKDIHHHIKKCAGT